MEEVRRPNRAEAILCIPESERRRLGLILAPLTSDQDGAVLAVVNLTLKALAMDGASPEAGVEPLPEQRATRCLKEPSADNWPTVKKVRVVEKAAAAEKAAKAAAVPNKSTATGSRADYDTQDRGLARNKNAATYALWIQRYAVGLTGSERKFLRDLVVRPWQRPTVGQEQSLRKVARKVPGTAPG